MRQLLHFGEQISSSAHASHSSRVSAAEARELHDLTGTPEKRVELVPGSLHGTFLVDGSARVRAELECFLRNPAAAVP